MKAARVLEAVATAEPSSGITAVQVSSRLGLDRTSTHRLLKTLALAGLVHQADDNRYHPGPALLAYALSLASQVGHVPTVRPALAWLVEMTGETATFSIALPDQTRVITDQVESPHASRWVARVGIPAPLYAGAPGKAILSAWPDEAVARYLERVKPEPLADGGIVDANALRTQLALFRKQGYAWSRSERVPDGAAVAAPILGSPGFVIGAVAIVTPAERLDARRLDEFGQLVRQAATRLAHAFGGLPTES